MPNPISDNTWSDYVAMLRRRWRPAFIVAASIALGTVYVAYSLPAVYQSSATILIEEQGIPTDVVQTTVNSYAEQRLQTIYQRVTASPDVLEMIGEFDLYSEDRADHSEEQLVDRFRDSTVMSPQNVMSVNSRTGREAIITFGFEISFDDADPTTARDIAQELADKFVTQNSALRTEVAQRTTEFLDSEAADIEKEIAAVSSRIAEFKEANAGNLPEDQNVNLGTWERSRDELTRVETDLRAARETRALLESEIIDTPRYRPVINETGDPVLGGVERLGEAQQELVRLRGRYSENHPSIISLKREIASLSGAPENRAGLAAQIRQELTARRIELSAAQDSYSDSHPDVTRLKRAVASLEAQLADVSASSTAGARPNNPLYLQLRTRINTARAEINDLSSRRAELTSRIDEFDRRRLAAPQVERLYSELEQERNLLMERYRELRGLGGEAELGQALETGQSGERLTIIEPARIPSSPVSPNRVSLTFLGVVLAIAAGLGIASLTDAMDTKIRGRQDILQLLDTPPMSVVPYVEDKTDLRRRRGTNAAMAVGTLAAVGLVVRAVLA